MTTPPGGDWAGGERVFGPPTGTLDADWLVPLVREAVPAAGHADARAAVVAARAALLADPGATERDVLGRVLQPLGVDGRTDRDGPVRSHARPQGDVEPAAAGPDPALALARAALVVVRAARRAYDAS